MKSLNLHLAVLLFFCSAPSWAHALVIPQVVDGEVWQTTIVVTNTTAATAQASLNFFVETSGNATQPWNLSFLEVSSTQSISLPPGATILFHTPGTAAALSQGWGQVVADTGVVAYTIFAKRPVGLPAQVGTSPATASASRILVPFDNTLGNVAAMALANTSSSPETVTVSFRTTGGTITQSTLTNVPPQGHVNAESRILVDLIQQHDTPTSRRDYKGIGNLAKSVPALQTYSQDLNLAINLTSADSETILNLASVAGQKCN